MKLRSVALVAGLFAACWSALSLSYAVEDKAPVPAPTEAAKKLGGSIDGYRFEFACKMALPENAKPGDNCASALATGDPKKTDQFTVEKTFGGEKGKKYNVTLRFRGVVEPMKYKDGKKDGDYFYISGEPDNGTYNIYKITIGSPDSHYYLNRQDTVGHRVFTIDYTKTIEIAGGTTITFHGNGQNGLMISNAAKLVVPDVEPAPKPFNGQFIQVNVLDVVEVK